MAQARLQSVVLLLLFSALLITTPVAHAKGENSGAKLTKMMGTMCPKFVLEMISRPEMAAALRFKPVDVLAVSSCTEKRFAADSRLQAYISVDEATLKTRIASEQFKPYLVARLFTSSMACLTPSIDESLAAVPLGQ